MVGLPVGNLHSRLVQNGLPLFPWPNSIRLMVNLDCCSRHTSIPRKRRVNQQQQQQKINKLTAHKSDCIVASAKTCCLSSTRLLSILSSIETTTQKNIAKIAGKFIHDGSIGELHRGNSGRPKTAIWMGSNYMAWSHSPYISLKI